MWLFFVTQYNSSLSNFVPNFKILTQVVAEKSLTEKKFTDRQTNQQTDKPTDRQTNIITEKAKTIYPLYTSYRGYKHPKLPISIKIPVTLLQIVYICMAAISPNSSSRTTSLLTCQLRGCNVICKRSNLNGIVKQK